MHCQHSQNLHDAFIFFNFCDRPGRLNLFGFVTVGSLAAALVPQKFVLGPTTAFNSSTACLITSSLLSSPIIYNGDGYVLLYNLPIQKCFIRVVGTLKIKFCFCISFLYFPILFLCKQIRRLVNYKMCSCFSLLFFFHLIFCIFSLYWP